MFILIYIHLIKLLDKEIKFCENGPHLFVWIIFHCPICERKKKKKKTVKKISLLPLVGCVVLLSMKQFFIVFENGLYSFFGGLLIQTK